MLFTSPHMLDLVCGLISVCGLIFDAGRDIGTLTRVPAKWAFDQHNPKTSTLL